MKVFLETERLRLREFTEEDADLLLELDSDPEVMRYIGPYGLPDSAAYRERVRTKWIPYYARGKGYGFWAALEKATGAFLGWVCLRPALDYLFAAEAGHRANEVELGYRLRRAAWGRGYATEAARALVPKAFAESDAACVVATALVGNVASTRVMEKAGLQRVGQFAMPGFDQPGVKYSLCRFSAEAGG
jgi:RimJ/RimL family protein N-acetyltransferase